MRRAGFRETDLPAAEVIEKLQLPKGDYFDEVLLFRILPVPPATFAPEQRRTYVFIDSEFTSLEAPELISVGAVATDSTRSTPSARMESSAPPISSGRS
jgi:hypothetical protein